jgi:nucleotidyltransferase/DNA polymerase involved in DNA repair
MKILRSVSDCVEPLSIDEAFIDVTGSQRLFGDGEAIGHRLKQQICDQTSLTASVGVASNKLVAKIASEMNKPDGLTLVRPGEEARFLAPLPVRRLWGIGPKAEERLLRVGIQTLGDLARLPEDSAIGRLGTHGLELRLLARGVDDRPVLDRRATAKSIGHEHTFDHDVADIERLRRALLDLADSVGRRLRRAGVRGRTITLKYRDETFRTLTRARTLKQPTDSGDELFRVAWHLFESVHEGARVRLIGVSASGLDTPPQKALFEPETSTLDDLRDRVAKRFGGSALIRASLLERRERRHPESRPEESEEEG